MWLRIYVMRAASFDLCVRDGTGICGRKRWAGGARFIPVEALHSPRACDADSPDVSGRFRGSMAHHGDPVVRAGTSASVVLRMSLFGCWAGVDMTQAVAPVITYFGSWSA
jgi:hypothetical protein